MVDGTPLASTEKKLCLTELFKSRLIQLESKSTARKFPSLLDNLHSGSALC
jgi:hypothetical protein